MRVNMRLKQNEVNVIKSSILKHINDAKTILFGSRVFDDKKGGDIDIFIETEKQIDMREQIKILTDIEMGGVARKVGIVLKTPNTKEQSIYKMIYQEGIVL